MMLNSLVIKNFRILEDFSIDKLGRVNLIVGKNNSGKSTLLHALRIYAGNIELAFPEDITNSYNYNYGHGKSFFPDEVFMGENKSNLFNPATFSLQKTPCSFIATQSFSITELESEWKKIELSIEEDIVTRALQLILPSFQRLVFDGEPEHRWIKVRLTHFNRPIPLEKLGNGLFHILQIAIKMISAQGGFLLIDEFENGLHYSIQEKVWLLLFEMAEKLNIQIFATTHSKDCIESFAKVAIENKSIEGILLQMCRNVVNRKIGDREIKERHVTAQIYDKEALYELTALNMELR
jgi:AAA15 family ATPase/GTPase